MRQKIFICVKVIRLTLRLKLQFIAIYIYLSWLKYAGAYTVGPIRSYQLFRFFIT